MHACSNQCCGADRTNRSSLCWHVTLGEQELADQAAAGALTVRHLLQHTGGWEGDYTLALGAQAGGSGRDAMENNARSLRGAEVFGLPGKRFSYNNGAFELCGALVEAVCPGKLFEEVMYEEVIAPLGLQRTFMYSRADGEGESHIYSPEHPTTPGRSTAVGHTRQRSAHLA
jgi:CubicO group peptidase (beta-lactamase class C family)